jgi:hypothetical protein
MKPDPMTATLTGDIVLDRRLKWLGADSVGDANGT